MSARVIIGASAGPRGTTLVRVKETSLDEESMFMEDFLLSFASGHDGGWSIYDAAGKRRFTRDRLTLDAALRFVLEMKGRG